jgi:LysR family transcriptional regulator, hydrogen peroxide-inducible genes activator
MELHQLRYFVAVAQTGNFSRAAEKCFVSQPSLSQQIQKLERQLKRPLFHRLGRKAVLTDAGRLLLDRATQILAGVEDAQRRLQGGADAEGGRLSVGAIPTIAPYVLPGALERFVKSSPRAELIIREDVTAHLIAAVAEGELDLALVALPIEDSRLHAEPLLTEPLLLALPPKHPLAKRRKAVSIQELAGERFILMGDMHCLGETILNFCRAHECQPFIACRSSQITTIQQLIGLGQGISLLPEMARRADQPSRLVYRPLADPQPERKLAVIWHKHYFHSPLAHKFLAELRLWAKEAVRV